MSWEFEMGFKKVLVKKICTQEALREPTRVLADILLLI